MPLGLVWGTGRSMQWRENLRGKSKTKPWLKPWKLPFPCRFGDSSLRKYIIFLIIAIDILELIQYMSINYWIFHSFHTLLNIDINIILKDQWFEKYTRWNTIINNICEYIIRLGFFIKLKKMFCAPMREKCLLYHPNEPDSYTQQYE
jgi:hypothetical protein